MENENFFSEKYFITSDNMFTSAQKPIKTCQDYSLVGNDPFPFLIISDGCGSSKNTDIGARIISHVAKSFLPGFICLGDIVNFGKLIIKKSQETILNLNIENHCLDATLIISFIENDQIHLLMYGDGHIFLLNVDDKLIWRQKISFEANAPYYLSYQLDPDRNQIYLDFAEDKKMKKIQLGRFEITETDHFEFTYNTFSLDYVKSVIITSDGIESFFNLRTGEKIPEEEIIKEITSFKNTKGEFIKRRIKKMMEDLAKQEIYNSDDISVAGFMIERNI